MSEDEDDDLLDTQDLNKIRNEPNEQQTKVNRVQNQLTEVIDGVRTNIVKVLERGQVLDDLHDRSEVLTTSANIFQTRAKQTRKAMWLRTCRV